MLRDVRRGCDRRIGRDALQAVGNPKDQVKLLTGSMVRGNKEAVDLKFKLRSLEANERSVAIPSTPTTQCKGVLDRRSREAASMHLMDRL